MNSFISNFLKHSLASLRPPGLTGAGDGRYDKSLIYKLMCNHQDLFQLFMELKFSTKRGEHERLTALLSKCLHSYSSHILLENQKLYPVLDGTYGQEQAYISTMAQFRRRSVELHERIGVLHEFCKNPSNLEANLEQFDVALNSLRDTLDKLITEKELDLYPLYNRLPERVNTLADPALTLSMP